MLNCSVCGAAFSKESLVSAHSVRDTIQRLIRQDVPTWTHESYICSADLARYRARYVHSLLESEKGELSQIEQEVLTSLQQHQILSSNIDAQFEQKWSFGEKLADHIAAFGGSWLFLIMFSCFIIVWIALNSIALFFRSIDPYPYILLNLLLSCLAAIQAPIIMMSQNRQEAKDRLRSQHDYQVNLKAELEIRLLHEKLDHLLSHQWERLAEIQEVQLDLLAEMTEVRKRQI